MKFTTKSNTTRLNTALLAVLLAAAPALGQEPPKTPVFVEPVPLMQEGRFQPGVRVEGLITARYTVKADGSTDDIEILGGFTNPFYENAIRETIKKWTFTPGSVDGTPRDFLNQEYTFKFRVSDTLAISKEVNDQLQVIRETLDKKEFADAGKQINSILRRGVQSVLDYGLMNEMMVQVNLGLEDPFAALESSQLATASSPGINGEPEYLLTPGLLQDALRQQVMVAATIRQQGTSGSRPPRTPWPLPINWYRSPRSTRTGTGYRHRCAGFFRFLTFAKASSRRSWPTASDGLSNSSSRRVSTGTCRPALATANWIFRAMKARCSPSMNSRSNTTQAVPTPGRSPA
jgi:hypothetical protein